MTDYHGPLSGMLWLHVIDQVVWQGDGYRPVILNSDFAQDLNLLSLTSSSV